MKKFRVGITGQTGFIGSHLTNECALLPDKIEIVSFEKSFFENADALRDFVKKCDVIVHLAGVNRDESSERLYESNVTLAEKLIDAMQAANAKPKLIFSSSTQETLGNAYGKSKAKCRTLFADWAEKNDAKFTALIVPNVFGPFSKPNYNTFIATFAYKLTHGQSPEIINDNSVKLIYVSSLCKFILRSIFEPQEENVLTLNVPPDFRKKVSEILELFQNYRALYFDNGIIPILHDKNEINLFNTFRSFIDIDKFFPKILEKHSDERGVFVETVKVGIGGQVSFSTTKLGVTRGNHFHTRKIERFAVLKGKAQIQMRQIGTDKVFSFDLSSENPAFVDMPVWFSHNITNIGNEELLTQFWINEWYDANDADTFFEKV